MKKCAILLTCCLFLQAISVFANNTIHKELEHFGEVYSGLFTVSIDGKYIIWNDGFLMPVGDIDQSKTLQEKIAKPVLIDQIEDVHYPAGIIDLAGYFNKNEDPGRIRYEAFSRKMYGDSQDEVRTHLITIDWMPNTFKKTDGTAQYQISVTTVNHVNEKLKEVSAELDALVKEEPSYKKYLSDPGGTFSWRYIANTNRLSYHSFGMTIDINVGQSSYWQWNVYSLYVKPTVNAIVPENIPGKAVVLVNDKAYFVEDHKIAMKNNMNFTANIVFSQNQKNQLADIATDGEIKRDDLNNALINSIMQQALANGNREISEESSFEYYPNQIPWPIILIFEKYGFIWGGKWHHYDTMHFEYRPELFD